MDWNIQHFEQILKNEKTDYYRDASIQRFCLVFEATLKTLSAFAEESGAEAQTTEECFQFAETRQWTDDTSKPVLNDYQSVKDGFKPSLAETVYPRLKDHHAFFQKLQSTVSQSS
jgi:hypothetical protein|tara:strand:- start:952 stop:1296 length:345 start_codon:yes stop_codon:yes gene_type:complete